MLTALLSSLIDDGSLSMKERVSNSVIYAGQSILHPYLAGNLALVFGTFVAALAVYLVLFNQQVGVGRFK